MHAGTRPGPRLPLRRVRRRRLPAALLGLGVLGLLLGAPAGAQEADEQRHVDVVQVSGWIDPVVVDFLGDALDDAEAGGAEAIVLQLDSPGALVEVDELVAQIESSTVPVGVWVGGVGARAMGGAGELAVAGHITGLAPRADLEVDGRTYGPRQAVREGFAQLDQNQSAVLPNFIAFLDGQEFEGREIDTATFTEQEDGPPEVDIHATPRFVKLDLGPRMLHTVASPPVAYLLLLAGLALVLFELYTGGIGIAGGVGAVSLALSAYGLAILPTNLVGLAVLAVGFFGFAVDVQTGVPRFWTAVGVLGTVVGSVLLYDDPVSLGWLPLVGGVVGVVLLMLAGLPATVRSRFSTPTIGRESMIGEVGEAVGTVAPEGVVKVRDALWPARINRATPVEAGDAVRVVAIHGAQLEVERVE